MNYDITHKDRVDICENMLRLIDDYMETNVQLYKKHTFLTDIYVAVFEVAKELYNAEIIHEYILRSILNESIMYYFKTIGIPRSYEDTFAPSQTEADKQKIKTHLHFLRSVPQSEQKTDMWYLKRHGMLTASTIWKALDTQSCINSIIYKKCVPINITKYKTVNTSSPFHHGHKYEPLSTQFYEKIYDTEISEWGCLPHIQHDFLGASPDGINTKYNNPRYGRLLEIKNVVSREINGIPLKKYWIQMQLQMEVTQIAYCDFLETRFMQFENEEEFKRGDSFHLTKEGKTKGIFVQFHGANGPIYKYPPFQCDTHTFDIWYDKCLDENPHLSWVTNIYWWLEEYSCVLVPANKKWFKTVLPQLSHIWNIIVKERETGFEHRKPKKRVARKKNTILSVNTESLSETQIKD